MAPRVLSLASALLLKKTAQAPEELDSALSDVVTEAMEDDDERRHGERRRPETAVR